MNEFLPNGASHYAIGGVLIGLGIGAVYLLTGRVAGASSFLTAVQAVWSRRPFFVTASWREERRWKGLLLAGVVVGAALWTWAFGESFTTDVQWWRLLAGGVLVGLGTRMGRGCTSGHGICGVSALSPASILSTAIFMLVAIATAAVVARLGVAP